MPAKSKAQRRLMQAALNDPEVRKKHNITKAQARRVLGKGEKKK